MEIFHDINIELVIMLGTDLMKKIRNYRMVQMKENFIELLQELVEKKSLGPEIQIISKSGKKKHMQIKNLTSSSITRRIKYLEFNEIIHRGI